MLEARVGYSTGEYDVEFKGGKMYIQSFLTGKTGNGFGEIKVDKKAQTFEIDNWVGDYAIWPHDHMYGAFMLEDGEQQIFNFLEMAISDKPITKLDSGAGRYLIGFNCKDHSVCDQSKASPHPGFWSLRG